MSQLNIKPIVTPEGLPETLTIISTSSEHMSEAKHCRMFTFFQLLIKNMFSCPLHSSYKFILSNIFTDAHDETDLTQCSKAD